MDKFTFYNTAWEYPNNYPEHDAYVKQGKGNKDVTCKV